MSGSAHERTTTGEGRPAVVLASPEDLEGFVETLEILSTPGELVATREGEAAAAAGDVLTPDQVRAELAARTGPARG